MVLKELDELDLLFGGCLDIDREDLPSIGAIALTVGLFSWGHDIVWMILVKLVLQMVEPVGKVLDAEIFF